MDSHSAERDQEAFSKALNRGFYSLLAVFIIAPGVLIALRPTSALVYGIAMIFLPGFLMAFIRKKQLDDAAYNAIVYQHWQETRPSVFQLPFWITLTRKSVSTSNPIPSDLEEAYRRLLISQRSLVLFTACIFVVGLPVVFYFVSSAVGRPFKWTSLTIPGVVAFSFLVSNLSSIAQELKQRKHFDRWVETGCPNDFSLDTRKK